MLKASLAQLLVVIQLHEQLSFKSQHKTRVQIRAVLAFFYFFKIKMATSQQISTLLEMIRKMDLEIQKREAKIEELESKLTASENLLKHFQQMAKTQTYRREGVSASQEQKVQSQAHRYFKPAN